MAIKKEDRIAFLKQRQLFKDLEEADIAKIAARLDEYNIPAKEELFSHGDRGSIFYIIYRGKVRLWRKEGDEEVELAVMEDGDVFGEEALLFNRPRPSSATVLEDTHFLTLDAAKFNWLLHTYPDIKLNLRSIAESHQRARRLRFTWLQPGEVIHLITRRHKAALFFDLAKPFTALLLAAFFLLITAVIPAFTTISRIAGAFLLVVGFFWSIWEVIDWQNDYFIVTNQRVIWLEHILYQSASRREAPMDAIQSVNVETSQFGRIWGYGNVFVRTFTGTGSLMLTNVDNPNRFRDLIQELLMRIRDKAEIVQSERIRQSIRQTLGLEAVQPVEVALPQPEPEEEPKWTLPFIKTREVKGDIITYHKHWWVLLAGIWLPLIGLAGMISVSVLLYSQNLTLGGTELPLVSTISVLIGGNALFLGMVGYQFLDWKNDIYRLTNDTIIDSERKPLGQEITKSAPIVNIISLEHQRDGILRLLLNFGNVNIVVADTKLTFYDVHNPAQVQQDIYNRQEQLKHDKQEAEDDREHTRMAEWLKTYHDTWTAQQESAQHEEEE